MSEDEEKDDGDEEEEAKEEQVDKGKALDIVTVLRKNAQGTKKKLVVTPLSPLPPNKPRIRVAISS